MQTAEIKQMKTYSFVDYADDGSTTYSELAKEVFQLIIFGTDGPYKLVQAVYEGPTKAKVVSWARKEGYIVTRAELKAVKVVEGTFKDMR